MQPRQRLRLLPAPAIGRSHLDLPAWWTRLSSLLQRYERRDRLAFQFVRTADHSRFSDSFVSHQRRLDFHGAEAMAGNVDDIVDAPHDPEISVFIFACAVAGEVHTRNLGPVLLHVAVGIAVDSAQHSRPRLRQDQEAAGAERDGLAVHGHDFGDHAGEGSRGRSGLGSNCAGQRRDHDLSGFGLPPSVHDGTTVVADHFAIPHPGFWIDWFADSTEQSQTLELMFLRPLVAPLDERANGGGRGVQNINWWGAMVAP